jgi:hypothetical protein
MSEQITTGGESATLSAAEAKLSSFFGGGEAAPAPAQAATPAPADTAPQEPKPETPTPEPKQPDGSLAELIRQQRKDREVRQAKERESADLRTQLEEARAQLAKVSKTDIMGDPIGFAQAHGLSEQEMALVGQAYLYHLVPDKAPPDLRYKMLEAKTARERKADEERKAAEARAQEDTKASEQVQQYTAVLGVAVQTWDSGDHPFPSSQAWFGGNHDEYRESLVHTARNLAEMARERGEMADLSPKAVASALEQDIASRAARFRSTAAAPTQQSAKVEPATPAPGGKQPAVLSTRGQGGSPLPPAASEEERVARAIAAAFPSR